jgi:hypothetical protein
VTIEEAWKFLTYPDTVIFVGSGISCWSDLPDWKGLIAELVLFIEDKKRSSSLVRKEAEAGDLLQAASYGFAKLTPQEIGTFMREVTRMGRARPVEIHKSIVELGPTCFVTTNYDDLIEKSLGQWRSEEYFRPPVTNMDLSGIAEIITARAANFVFKPHGDASKSESLILTREQYRQLLPGGERHQALEALKTLLATRPVLYLGFGLRDPDFLYLRDILLNTFKAPTIDHYAIVADVSGDEVEYWRQNYSIHLSGYTTKVLPGGKRDHTELLTLLTRLARSRKSGQGIAAVRAPTQTQSRLGDARILALMRYTAGLLRLGPVEQPMEIHVDRVGTPRWIGPYISSEPFANWTATRFLTEGPSRAILAGPPGAGKSFALRLAVMRIAEALNRACLDGVTEMSELVLPVLIDLKLYRGNLKAQIEASLPPGFNLIELLGDMRLKVFLDAYNEMPLSYLEGGSVLLDMEDLKLVVGEFDYIYASRTSDGLAREGVPEYELAYFDLEHVSKALLDRGINLNESFGEDVLRLLSRPFFFGLVTSGYVKISAEATPTDVYASYFEILKQQFLDRFGADIALTETLSLVAHRALETGQEAFPLQWITTQIGSALRGKVLAEKVVNWLISRHTLIPYSGGRVSFVHQSITEFLAALRLIALIDEGLFSIRNTVALRKWDQCLFLALGLMPAKQADAILDYLIRTDLSLALKAARYAGEWQSYAIAKLLAAIINRVKRGKDIEERHSADHEFSQLRFDQSHEDLLEVVVQMHGSLGGEAVKALADLRGPSYKPRLLELLEANLEDYNFSVNGVVPAVEPWLNEEDLPILMRLASTRRLASDDDNIGTHLDVLLSRFEPDAVIEAARSAAGKLLSEPLVDTLCWAFRKRDDKRSFEILCDFLDADNIRSPVFALHSRCCHRLDLNIRWLSYITERHIDLIWGARYTTGDAAHLLQKLCSVRQDLAGLLEKRLSDAVGIERAALLYCLDGEGESLWRELALLDRFSKCELLCQEFRVIRLADLNWSGKNELYARLLGRGVAPLARSLLGEGCPCIVEGLGTFSQEQLWPALDWAVALPDSDGNWWLKRVMGSFLGQHGDGSVRQYIICSLDSSEEILKDFIIRYVLPFSSDITTDDLSEGAIEVLLRDLRGAEVHDEIFFHPLGRLATERFVNEQLIPLTGGGGNAVTRKVEGVLAAAGRRHGRRYILPD